MNSPEAVEIVRTVLQSLAEGDLERAFGLMGDECVVTCPFSPPPTPTEWVGKEAWRPLITGFFGDLFQRFEWPELDLQPALDPAVVFGTGKSKGVTADGKIYANEYCWIFRIEDGLIVEYREFFNPLVTAKFFELQSKDSL